jgi:uncharacterized surface protein with fasciclin (FAS1) repeats
MLVQAIDRAGLTETLQGDGPFTVLAPIDEAFEKLPPAVRDRLMQGQGAEQEAASDQLKQILSYHILPGQEFTSEDLLGREVEVSTLSGERITLDGTGAVVVLVPTGLTIVRVGDEVFVRREVAAMTQPAVTVSTAGQQGEQQSAEGQQHAAQGQQQAAQSGQQGQHQAAQSSQQGQQRQQQSGQQQAAASGQQGQQQGQQGQQQPMAEQQGLLRAAMVVEPGIQADNGVIHGINEVLVPQPIEQQLMSGRAQQDQG